MKFPRQLHKNRIAQATALCTLIGTIAGGLWALDSRYARAGDVRQQVSEIKGLYLQSELRGLKKEKFELEVTKQRRPLSNLEQGRLREVSDEIQRVQDQLKK